MIYEPPHPARTFRGVFLSLSIKMGRVTVDGQKNGPPRHAPMCGDFFIAVHMLSESGRPWGMGRWAPHALARGLGGHWPYAKLQRTARRMSRRPPHLCAGSCRLLAICQVIADGHEVWAAALHTHTAPGRLVAGHEDGPSKADSRKCGLPHPVRTWAGSWRLPAI